MPRSRSLAAGCLALLFAFGLSGCSPAVPKITETPEPVVTAPFKTEEEALKAATEAYAKYSATVSEILNEGGVGPERIDAVATGPASEDFRKQAQAFEERGRVMTGAILVDNVALQQFSTSPPAVTAYVCDNVKEVDLLDSSGQSIVRADRPDATTFEVGFVVRDGQLVVESRHFWNGASVCP